jgi:excisionase family DNA binding protein
MMADKLLRLSQAALQSECSVRTLRRAIDAGELASVRLGQSGKSDRIHPDDLAAWWRAKRNTSCQSQSVQTAPIKLPSAGADARLASLLGIGASQTQGKSSSKCSPTSKRLRLVESRKS